MHRYFWIPITLGLTAYVLLPLPGQSAPLPSGSRPSTPRSPGEEQEGVLTRDITSFNDRISGLQGRDRRHAAQQDRPGRARRKPRELQRVRDDLELAQATASRGSRSGWRRVTGPAAGWWSSTSPTPRTLLRSSSRPTASRPARADRVCSSGSPTRTARSSRACAAQGRFEAPGGGARAARAGGRRRGNAVLASATRRHRHERRPSTLGNIAEHRDDRRAVAEQVRDSRSDLQERPAELEAAHARVTGQLQARRPRVRSARHGQLDLAGQRLDHLAVRDALGPPARGHRHRVPAGTPIRAADGGTVVLLGPVSGYGNYTCIQHAGSLSTCYAHQSSFGDLGRRVRQPGPGDRLRRLHRPLLRRPPSLRGASERVAG